MRAIDEIDVSTSRRAEEHLCTLRFTARGMGGEIIQAEIGLRFNDHAGGFAMEQDAAEQMWRELNCWTLKKLKVHRLGVPKEAPQRPRVLNTFDSLGVGFVSNPQCTLEH